MVLYRIRESCLDTYFRRKEDVSSRLWFFPIKAYSSWTGLGVEKVSEGKFWFHDGGALYVPEEGDPYSHFLSFSPVPDFRVFVSPESIESFTLFRDRLLSQRRKKIHKGREIPYYRLSCPWKRSRQVDVPFDIMLGITLLELDEFLPLGRVFRRKISRQ